MSQPTTAPFFPTMLVVSSPWNGRPSFQLIPVEESCPYIDIIFDPAQGLLGVVSKQHKPKMQLVKRLDDNGDEIRRSGKTTSAIGDTNQVQRILFDSYYDYAIEQPADVRAFVELHARNPEHAAFRQFFPVSEVALSENIDNLLVDRKGPHPEAAQA